VRIESRPDKTRRDKKTESRGGEKGQQSRLTQPPPAFCFAGSTANLLRWLLSNFILCVLVQVRSTEYSWSTKYKVFCTYSALQNNIPMQSAHEPVAGASLRRHVQHAHTTTTLYTSLQHLHICILAPPDTPLPTLPIYFSSRVPLFPSISGKLK
jgi:hypothetical protein